MTSTQPAMFQLPDIFPGTFQNNVDHTGFGDIPSTISNVPMGSPPSLFNKTFDSAMSSWGLPEPEIFDSEMDGYLDETAQSQNEIVQKILLCPTPTAKCYSQHEFFFIGINASSSIKSYSHSKLSPQEALTLHDTRKPSFKCNSVKDLVQKYRPAGSFFNYVEIGAHNKSSTLVAYSIGGLCDILNVWHVPIVPGIQLYFVAYEKHNKVLIIPYAGNTHPLQDSRHEWNKESRDIAIVDVGIVCAGNSRPPLQTHNPNYVASLEKDKCFIPITEIHSQDTTDPNNQHVRGNILRIRMSCLQWQFFPQK